MESEDLIPVKGCPVFHGSSWNAKQTVYITSICKMKYSLVYTYTAVQVDSLIGEGLFNNPFF